MQPWQQQKWENKINTINKKNKNSELAAHFLKHILQIYHTKSGKI